MTVRWTVAPLTVLSPLLFYLAAQRLFASVAVSTITAAVYSLSATIWFSSIFNSGLYANFFGILASLFLIVAFLDAASSCRPSWRMGRASFGCSNGVFLPLHGAHSVAGLAGVSLGRIRVETQDSAPRSLVSFLIVVIPSCLGCAALSILCRASSWGQQYRGRADWEHFCLKPILWMARSKLHGFGNLLRHRIRDYDGARRCVFMAHRHSEVAPTHDSIGVVPGPNPHSTD